MEVEMSDMPPWKEGSRAVVIVQLKDGTIRLIRTETAGDFGVVRIYNEDMAGADKGDVARILGNYYHYPDWVTLTDEQLASAEPGAGPARQDGRTAPKRKIERETGLTSQG
jgi:hypothetical protein